MRSSLVCLMTASLILGCGGGAAKQGGERQGCYPNGTCNAGLTCLSNVCVNAGDAGGTGGSGGGGSGGSGGGAACLTAANHGDLGNVTSPAASQSSTMIDWALPLEAGSPRDEFDIQIFDGMGAFASGVAPGTFTLSGDDLNYATCGLCVLIYENIDAQTNYRGVYIATGGTVTLTSVAGEFIGTASNIKFQHVNIDANTLVSTPDPDGCRSAVDHVGFDVAIVAN